MTRWSQCAVISMPRQVSLYQLLKLFAADVCSARMPQGFPL